MVEASRLEEQLEEWEDRWVDDERVTDADGGNAGIGARMYSSIITCIDPIHGTPASTSSSSISTRLVVRPARCRAGRWKSLAKVAVHSARYHSRLPWLGGQTTPETSDLRDMTAEPGRTVH